MTVEQLREWLRQWVIKTTGLPAEEITDDKPMQSFGLSSRDVVILSGELENLLDKQLDATIAYQYPTIQALAQQLLAGGPGLGAGAPGERAGAAGKELLGERLNGGILVGNSRIKLLVQQIF